MGQAAETLSIDASNIEPAPAWIRVERFRLLSEVGRGGMGEVWRAWDDARRTLVAVKRVPPHQARASLQARLRREGRVLCGLAHPNIVRGLDLVETPSGPLLSLQLLDGVTLEDRLERGPMGAAEAWRWAQGLLLAAAETHRRGLVHRDIKPANLYLTRSGVVKLLDFGLVREDEPDTVVPQGEAAARSVEGVVVGTVGYMPPEQEAGGLVDARADVYALATLLYVLFSGVMPHTRRRLGDPWTGPADCGALPPALAPVVERALALDPGRRPANAGALLDALDLA